MPGDHPSRPAKKRAILRKIPVGASWRNVSYLGQPEDEPIVERMLSHVPLRRPGTCDEISHAVMMLAAPEAGYFNGAVITMDGGWTCGYARDF